MSGQHWIDALFRKRMKHRDFPVETGEFEEMRALLEQRNATTGAVGGAGFSKWWLSILIPMAGLLWWTVFDDGFLHAILPDEQRVSAEQPRIERDFRRQRQRDLRRVHREFLREFAFGLTQHHAERVKTEGQRRLFRQCRRQGASMPIGLSVHRVCLFA